MSPTHPVRASNGYYYTLMALFPDKLQPGGGLCVMRTDRLDDPASWRAWDGRGFNLRLQSPYVSGRPAPLCTFLSTVRDVGYVVYSSHLERYMQIIPAHQWIDGRGVCGFYHALSADLVHWGDLHLIAEAKVWDGCETNLEPPGVLESVKVGYPSVLDHADNTVNFERTGRTPHLYYVRFNQGAFDRDLVRVPLTFTRLD